MSHFNKSVVTIKIVLFEKQPITYLTINNIVNLPVFFRSRDE